jgi:signal transduction histidine kinase
MAISPWGEYMVRERRHTPRGGQQVIAGVEIPARFVLPVENSLADRLPWFAHLRWVAAALVVLTGIGSIYYYEMNVRGDLIVLVGLGIALYNIPIRLLQSRATNHSISANIQIGLDWIALVALMHLTGGLHSPVLIFFVFHILLAAILLSALNAYIHAALATLLVGLIGYLEAGGFIDHLRPIWTDAGPPGQIELLVLVGSFGFSAFLCAFLASSVMHHLRAAEERQAELQSELADAVHRLDSANRELVALDEQKTQYTRTVTHQLRSPMSSIQALLGILIDGYNGELDDKARDLVVRAQRRTAQLLDTVRDLLDLAGMEFAAGPRQATRVEIAPLMKEIVTKYQPSAQGKNVGLEVDVEPGLAVNAVIEDIELTLDNLVSNAVKYSREGLPVTVKAWRESGRVLITIRDNGIGIPEAARKDLFTEFYRASNAKKTEPHGTGLGLSIVKRSVEKWNGEITFESVENDHTTFSLSFPEDSTGTKDTTNA